MALLLPSPFEIGFKRFDSGFVRQNLEVKIPSGNRTRFGIRARFSPQNGDKMPAHVKRAFEKALEYKKKKLEREQLEENQQSAGNQSDGTQSTSSQAKGDPVNDALKGPKMYRYQKDERNSEKEGSRALQQGENNPKAQDNTVEVEIITRDGVIKRKITQSSQDFSKVRDDENKGSSSLDFAGLQFSKKNLKEDARFQPAPSGTLPETEIITGYATNFGFDVKNQQQQQQAQHTIQNQIDGSQSTSQPKKGTGDAVLYAFEQAEAYKGQKNEISSAKEENTGHQQGEQNPTGEDNTVEMEIIARDGSIKRKTTLAQNPNIKDDKNNGISSVDFVELQFSEKKPEEGLSVGLSAAFEYPPLGPLPETENITGNVTNFEVDIKNPQEQQAYQDQQHVQNQNDGSQSTSSQTKKGTDDAVLDAFERARAYRHQQGEKSFAVGDNTVRKQAEQISMEEDNTVEVEIITRDGIIRRKFTPPADAFSNIKDYRNKAISSVDFPGLRFSEEKPKRQLPAGLNADIQLPPSGPLPEVEFIRGDTSKFGYEIPASTQGSSDLYKPKVATWGVFPRPENISKTFGGGRVIRPGDALESDEEKAAREARTRKLIDKYRQKTGQIVDPKVKAKCEKVLKEGNDLMEVGRLRDALVHYEKIMNEMVFQSELHGLAALQWSVCLETFNRLDEAREMYKKLSSHPNRDVMKKAKQLLFAFEAMEKMKISGSYTLDTSGYRKYFEAFTDGFNNNYIPTEEEKVTDQITGQYVLYIIFLLLPIVLVFAAAAYKRL